MIEKSIHINKSIKIGQYPSRKLAKNMDKLFIEDMQSVNI